MIPGFAKVLGPQRPHELQLIFWIVGPHLGWTWDSKEHIHIRILHPGSKPQAFSISRAVRELLPDTLQKCSVMHKSVFPWSGLLRLVWDIGTFLSCLSYRIPPCPKPASGEQIQGPLNRGGKLLGIRTIQVQSRHLKGVPRVASMARIPIIANGMVLCAPNQATLSCTLNIPRVGNSTSILPSILETLSKHGCRRLRHPSVALSKGRFGVEWSRRFMHSLHCKQQNPIPTACLYLSTCLPTLSPTCVPAHLPTCPSNRPRIYPSLYLSLFVCLSVCLPVCLF